jgi:hypothetical protein
MGGSRYRAWHVSCRARQSGQFLSCIFGDIVFIAICSGCNLSASLSAFCVITW